MRFYKVIAASFIILGCLFSSQQGQALDSIDSQCSLVKSRYSLKGDIHSINSKDIKEQFYPVFDMVLNTAENNTHSSVLDIQKLRQEITTLHLCVNLSKTALVGSGSRKGSVYFNQERTIILNAKELASHADSGAGLNIIHELLGALSYPDQNYEITTYLYSAIHVNSFGEETLATIEKALSTHLKNAAPINQNIMYAANGGVTGVGGGGDPEVVFLKALTLNFVIMNIDFFEKLFNERLDLDKLSLFVMKYKIETDAVKKWPDNAKEYFPSISYATTDRQISIVVRSKIWLKLMNGGRSAFDERTKFIQNLASSLIIDFLHVRKNEK